MILDLTQFTSSELHTMLEERKCIYKEYSEVVPKDESDQHIWKLMCLAQEQDIQKIENAIKHKENQKGEC